MLERLKRALVDSFVGAIALGYLLAQGISHFVNMLASPVAGWVSRKEYGVMVAPNTSLAGLSFRDALPELARFVVLLLIWYVLVRWLYFKPLGKKTSVPNPE
jgi:hypothetical protein